VTTIRVPASSANLGAGFDALGMALSIHFDCGICDDDTPKDARICDERHPATVAFHAAGGTGKLWVRDGIPMGRGLGFSGAARVGGALAAVLQRDGIDVARSDAGRRRAFEVALDLEGHPDNAAASAFGGVVACAGRDVVVVPAALKPSIVVWIPTSTTTSTKESRTKLSPTVSLDDAVFNLSRAALLVAAFASGDHTVLREATRDRLHQDVRLALVPDTRAALHAALDAGAWGAWLSGSGPTMACACAPADVSRIQAAMPAGGDVRVTSIDDLGATVG